ncbi:glycine/betaine ABC transporter [Longibacter salinarum]|uniref:Glycine/betaine ABC transporter n=1 Tax=Longibacter salinarum TaxID=1850348 RepID=A0A2A8CTK2_9BACT|nr:proline/glycine betaine ABC transporter permease [Longibacter salinarum]PEN11107.1 glycine/betaine ABC transporter [Longibacter salinarum]
MDIGGAFEQYLEWIRTNLGPGLDAIGAVVRAVVDALEAGLMLLPAWAWIIVFVGLAWWLSGRGVAIFTAAGMAVIAYGMDLWTATMETLALVLASTAIALAIGVPLGVAGAKRKWIQRTLRPVLDFMQTMPAFVYLIPAVLLFRIGAVPGVLATVVFAMPPVVRLTSLGIRQVPREIVEASQAFGATPWQQLWKVELPVALPTILAGINQTIMLALSMVVIAALIGAGGLGQDVLTGVTQLKIGLGFESGLAVVILAIFLDRVTQGLGGRAGEASAPKTA